MSSGALSGPYKGLIRPLRALSGPPGLYKALKGLIRPVKGFIKSSRALSGP